LIVEGLAVVNGAQTSGAIGSLDSPPGSEVSIPIRVVKSPNKEIVKNIIKFNNTQNKINASDFRSLDKVQKRLKKEFKKEFPELVYTGARRGGFGDKIERRKNTLEYKRTVQSIASFHQEPKWAYNETTKISEENRRYDLFFNQKTTAHHIFFTYTLFKSIEMAKRKLLEKQKKGESLSRLDETKIEFLKQRGAKWILLSAIAYSLDIIIDRRVEDYFLYKFNKKHSLEEAERIWEPIISVALSFCSTLEKPLEDALGTKSKNDKAIKDFGSHIDATKKSNKETYNEFSKLVSTNL